MRTLHQFGAPCKVGYFLLLSELLPPLAAATSGILYMYQTYHSCFKLVNSCDSQLKTRKTLRIISQNFRRLNFYPNTKSPLKLVSAFSILKDYCWNFENFRFRLVDSFSFQKNNYLDNMSCRYVIQSWLHEGSGELHVNIPTLVGPMETSRLHTSLVGNWKRKLGTQNFKLGLVDIVQNIAVMPTAKY